MNIFFTVPCLANIKSLNVYQTTAYWWKDWEKQEAKETCASSTGKTCSFPPSLDSQGCLRALTCQDPVGSFAVLSWGLVSLDGEGGRLSLA